MYTCAVRPEIASLSAYVPGMSIAEVRERYGLSRVIKMASNENPLGVSPLVRKVLATVWKRPSAIRRAAIPRCGKPWPVRTMSPRSASSSATALTRSSTC